MKKGIFTENEIRAYKQAYADLEKRQKEGDLVGKWDIYCKTKKSIEAAIKNVSIMREKKRYTDLLDAFTIAVGGRMQQKFIFPQIYTMRDDKEYCSLFAQYNSLGSRRALHTVLKALIADSDETSVRKNKGIPHNVSFTGFSKIMLGTGKQFTKNAKAYGTGLFNTDYLWQNGDGSTFRWKTDEVKNLCEMILASREAEAYASVINLSDVMYDLLYNEPDFIEFMVKISDDIEIIEEKPNDKKKDISYDAVFAATKNVRDYDQIQKMIQELEARGLGPEPIYSPHVRTTKDRVPKQFTEGDTILKSHIVDLKTHLPVLIDMPFIKRENEKKDTHTTAKIVVISISSREFRYGFYHDDAVKTPNWNYLNQEFLVGSTYLRDLDKKIKVQRCDIKFTIMSGK
ncbi:MAG: hypothetical protein WCL18_04800 [bacterium]